MAEVQHPGDLSQKEEPIPFFKTVDLTVRPKWDTSVSFVKELSRYIKDVPPERQDIDLAFEMQRFYGKEDAITILKQVQAHIKDSIYRRRISGPTILDGWLDRLKAAQGILKTPNWKDPSKIPPPIQFSAK